MRIDSVSETIFNQTKIPKSTKIEVEMPPKVYLFVKPSSQHLWTGLGQFVAPLLFCKQTNSDKNSCSFPYPKPTKNEHTNAGIMIHTAYDNLQFSLDFYGMCVKNTICKNASTRDKRCSRLFHLRLTICIQIRHARK